jgi:hypothetical protein
MTDTEPLTPREIRQGIAEKLAGLPGNVDANGKSDLDRQSDADRYARFTEAETPAVAEPPVVQAPMKPNALQGSTGATVPTPAPTNVLDAIRAQVAKHNIGA